ncbi:MAG: efflux RND transporter periplasmic adaptor subunit [Gammaproteobacteria bacterium]|nr:efflux RND transporter periplasmic adaptor subunit [Gammaproteobacteria bacterium]
MGFPKALVFLLTLYALTSAATNAAPSARIVTGDVIANRTVTLATRIMGRITRVYATEGDSISADQVIVEIDDTQYLAQLRSQEAAVDRARAEVTHRTRTRKRLQQLKKTNAVAQDIIDEATYGLRVAEASLKSALAQIDAIHSTLAETRIKVPFDSVVIKKMAEIGLVTQPGHALYEIQDQSRLKFRARVKERDLAHIKLNDQAQVTIAVLGDKPVNATVIRIIPNGDDRHTFIVELELPKRVGLYPGMFGKAVFQ